jgi:two-component system, OmpR family, response regulator
MDDEHVRKGKQILVVEDHPESVELLRMILEDEGYSVQSVGTGRRAIQAVSAPPSDETPAPSPDLILLDLRLPDMNGVEVVRELKENLPEVPPVVFLSADPPQSLKNAARSVGAAAVRKPFNLDELFEAIDRALAKPRDSDQPVNTQSPGFAK